jgi:hypothetical protein
MHLAVEPVEAETVRLIFRLYAEGDTRTGTPPLGIKQLVKWLNGRGYRTKAGGTFGVGPVRHILTTRSMSAVGSTMSALPGRASANPPRKSSRSQLLPLSNKICSIAFRPGLRRTIPRLRHLAWSLVRSS